RPPGDHRCPHPEETPATRPTPVINIHAVDRGSGVAAYAQRQGIDTATFTTALEPLLTPAIVGAEIARLCEDTDNRDQLRAYELNGRGLHALA
ncbi:hypothetical protein AB0N07_47980, partial [Streptomyces sp. NPDC051172]|uniref:hypothetical protein n=1 Tax=Streptomyces sp. NPDC051172 TaxID=3155796 RepID=UPI003444156A